MRVRVLYFAAMRELAGRDDEELELPPEVRTVAGFVEHLSFALPGFAERRTHVRVARNERFADGDEPLTEGDVLALIPPVAGG